MVTIIYEKELQQNKSESIQYSIDKNRRSQIEMCEKRRRQPTSIQH